MSLNQDLFYQQLIEGSIFLVGGYIFMFCIAGAAAFVAWLFNIDYDQVI